MFNKMEPIFDFRCKDNTFYRNNQKLWLFLCVFSCFLVDKSGCKDREVDICGSKVRYVMEHSQEQIDRKRKETDDNGMQEKE